MLDNSSGFKGIYFTLNPANPALLSRKANVKNARNIFCVMRAHENGEIEIQEPWNTR